MAVGNCHSVCITSNGEVYSWGHHGDVRLGYKNDISNPQPEPFPKKIPGIEGVSGLIKEVG